MDDSLFEFEEIPTTCPHCGRALVEGACSWCDRAHTPTKHLHRAGGPDTSAAAAGSIDATDLESLVYWAIEGKGLGGATADELLDLFPTFSYSSITARPAALKRKGLIFDSGSKRAGKSGRAQAVLVASKFRASESHDPQPDPVPVPPKPCLDCGSTDHRTYDCHSTYIDGHDRYGSL